MTEKPCYVCGVEWDVRVLDANYVCAGCMEKFVMEEFVREPRKPNATVLEEGALFFMGPPKKDVGVKLADVEQARRGNVPEDPVVHVECEKTFNCRCAKCDALRERNPAPKLSLDPGPDPYKCAYCDSRDTTVRGVQYGFPPFFVERVRLCRTHEELYADHLAPKELCAFCNSLETRERAPRSGPSGVIRLCRNHEAKYEKDLKPLAAPSHKKLSYVEACKWCLDTKKTVPGHRMRLTYTGNTWWICEAHEEWAEKAEILEPIQTCEHRSEHGGWDCYEWQHAHWNGLFLCRKHFDRKGR